MGKTTATRFGWCRAPSRCGSSAVAGKRQCGRKWQCSRKWRRDGPPAPVSRARRSTFPTGFHVRRSQGSPPDQNLGCSTAPSYVPSHPARTPQFSVCSTEFSLKSHFFGFTSWLCISDICTTFSFFPFFVSLTFDSSSVVFSNVNQSVRYSEQRGYVHPSAKASYTLGTL